MRFNLRGTYVITKKDYRLSDLVKAAGGQTQQAYLQGAVLERPLTDSERLKQQELKKIVLMNDSVDLHKIEVGDHNNVATIWTKLWRIPAVISGTSFCVTAIVWSFLNTIIQ